ncbi:Hypothetical Protein FCC1311_029961 [Hondaea fermentalgiana]|uniref:Uncharacterized protein n=1 Tax=Hondaea fermentalgiana TaxID=2315210 RepID=A0A2R5GGM8_9STRA|nr:Hypothetical Protein FCC1311_029961 [Hondaea fermentalgiana]|eukprot:GBG30037.1 Hypothetical Protein FCC1311_029961 [Hondaea fermentalgiana]
MRVLVTGGGGQLGGFLVRELLQGPRVEIGRGSAELPLHIAYTQHAQELAGLESLGEPDDDGWRRRRDEKSAAAIAVKGFKVDFATGSFDRGVKSPLDTGMDSSRIATDLNISLTSFAHGLTLAYPSTS